MTFGTFTILATKTGQKRTFNPSGEWPAMWGPLHMCIMSMKNGRKSPQTTEQNLKKGEDDLMIVTGVDLKKCGVGINMTRARCYVLFSFRFFSRSRQSSGRASKLAFFDAFPLQEIKQHHLA